MLMVSDIQLNNVVHYMKGFFLPFCGRGCELYYFFFLSHSRIFWVIVLGFFIALTLWFTISFYYTFSDAPTATSQVPNRRSVTTVPFPAVTICDGNRISRSALMDMAKDL